MNKKLYKLMNWPMIESIVYNEEPNPYGILGCRSVGSSVLYQMFYPNAQKVELVLLNGKEEKATLMEMADEMGYFACLISGKTTDNYKYRVYTSGEVFDVEDTYSVSYDSYKINDEEVAKYSHGIGYDSYKFMGSKVMKVEGKEGVRFTVWAPNALGVSVVGDFNRYTVGAHQMKRNDSNGIFELFIPGAKIGDSYQYSIKTKNSEYYLKNDPFAKKMLVGEGVKSVVVESNFNFNDDLYINNRTKFKEHNAAISIFQLYLGNFKRNKNGYLDYETLADSVVSHVVEMGYTHVEIMPVMESISDVSCGMITGGFFAISSRYGEIDGFKKFVDIMHQNDIGVILDWTPFHFDSYESGLREFDGTCLYEHLDKKKGVHPFYNTCLFNYARPEVTSYLLTNAIYFIDEFHIDGLNIPSVASMLYLDYGKNEGEWIANMYGGNENLEAIEFIKHLNSVINKRYDNVLMLAYEDSGYPNITTSVENGGLGFDLKINQSMIWDGLNFMTTDPLYRPYNFEKLTFDMIYQYSENYLSGVSSEIINRDNRSLLSFMYGDEESKYANMRLWFGYMMTHPGKKLIFEGQDIGATDGFSEDKEIDWSLLKNKDNNGIKKLVKDLNKLYREYPALIKLDDRPDGFEWINGIGNDACTISYLRKSDDERDTLLVVFNFANKDNTITVGTPLAGKYKEIFNTDSKNYNGKDKINKKNLVVSENGHDGRAYSIAVKLQALSMGIYKYIPFTEAEKYKINKKKEAAIANSKAEEYRGLALEAQKEAEAIRQRIAEAKKELKATEDRIKEAQLSEERELEKAKKALEESL